MYKVSHKFKHICIFRTIFKAGFRNEYFQRGGVNQVAEGHNEGGAWEWISIPLGEAVEGCSAPPENVIV